ncbi:MAG: Fe-S protein assembly co-chaperone HscB [Nitrospirae bacterium]|nr:Fe-S protein assembly co-chaperone HscB [Nitrospirota bacterium]
MEQKPGTAPKRTELHMARSMCWHCQSEITGEYFCEQCVKVQPLSKELDYFTCLGLPRLLNIDLAALEAKFYALSRSFHPDFYHNKTDSEQAISLGNSALLNTAYRTLKDPVQRAEYLLKLEAGSAKDIRTSPPADLFEEILALQEDLEEYRQTSPDQDPAALAPLKAKLASDRDQLEQRQRGMEAKLAEIFNAWDHLQTRAGSAPVDDQLRKEREAILKDLRELLSNRTYLRNIITDLVAATA